MLLSRHLLARVSAGVLVTLTAALLPAAVSADTSDAPATPGSNAASARQAAPLDLDLDRPTRGAAALRAIGDDLDRAAAVNGVSAARLRHILRTDDTAYVTSSGRLFYRDVRMAPERPTVQQRAPFPDAQTFTLHSSPGALRTIYLDFDGANVSGTFWNTAEGGGLADRTVSAFDTDGVPGTFSAGEKATIQEVWQRVAEDYAPFQVDVTTQAPPAARIDRSSGTDQEYGTTVVVSSDEDAHSRLCDENEFCTGIALIDVFDLVSAGPGMGHAYFQPAWAFTSYFDSAKSIADTASHEVGHNLGLNHWGDDEEAYYQGHGSWYPVMGSSLRPIGQWSKGEYPGAVAEQTGDQDDLELITTRGAPFRADDAGGTVATAAAALPTEPRVISTRDDVDVYALGSCSGPVSVTGATAYADPNLDLKLSLLDATGTPVATADPASGTQSAGVASGMGATVSYNATGTPLFVAVDGVGTKTFATQGYSDYGSLGGYELERTGSCGQAGVPSAPLGVTATPTGETSIGLSWTAPTSNGGSALTGYTVSRTGTTTVTLPAGTTTHPVTGLQPGTSYTFTVAAVNASGAGPGAPVTATTSGVVAGPTAPGAVTGLTAAWNVAAQEALVSWSPPAVDGGSAVQGYDVYVDDEFAGSFGSDTSGVVAGAAEFGFAPGSSHTVAVCAFNATVETLGCGPRASASFTATPRPATVPGAPQIGRATPGAAGGTRTAIVAWTPTSTGGSTITSYLVLAYKYSGSRVVATKTYKAGASVRRGQVPVGAGVWRFRVRALNAVGRSNPSGLSNAVTAR